MPVSSTDEIRRLLEMDIVWSAYALADLDPDYKELSDFLTYQNTLALIYRGIHPPILFAIGYPRGIQKLFTQVPDGRYTYTLLGSHKALIRHCLDIETEDEMWRMVLKKDEFTGTLFQGVVKLGAADLKVIQNLFSDHPDKPDSFSSSQLETGIFYGLFMGDELISLAGTHILSKWASVAAIGNVYTRSDQRNQGFATRVTAAVVGDAIEQGLETIVLNVAMDNQPALASYRKLGFWPHCGYYEGIGTLNTEQILDHGELNEQAV